MIHIANDASSRDDHVVVVAVTDRLGKQAMSRLSPGESVSVRDQDGDLVSVFDIPLKEQ